MPSRVDHAKLACAVLLVVALGVAAFALPATWDPTPSDPTPVDVLLIAAFYAVPSVLGALEVADAARAQRSLRTFARGAVGGLALALGVWVVVVLQTTPGFLAYEGYGAFLGPVFSVGVAGCLAAVVLWTTAARAAGDGRTVEF